MWCSYFRPQPALLAAGHSRIVLYRSRVYIDGHLQRSFEFIITSSNGIFRWEPSNRIFCSSKGLEVASDNLTKGGTLYSTLLAFSLPPCLRPGRRLQLPSGRLFFFYFFFLKRVNTNCWPISFYAAQLASHCSASSLQVEPESHYS